MYMYTHMCTYAHVHTFQPLFWPSTSPSHCLLLWSRKGDSCLLVHPQISTPFTFNFLSHGQEESGFCTASLSDLMCDTGSPHWSFFASTTSHHL